MIDVPPAKDFHGKGWRDLAGQITNLSLPKTGFQSLMGIASVICLLCLRCPGLKEATEGARLTSGELLPPVIWSRSRHPPQDRLGPSKLEKQQRDRGHASKRRLVFPIHFMYVNMQQKICRLCVLCLTALGSFRTCRPQLCRFLPVIVDVIEIESLFLYLDACEFRIPTKRTNVGDVAILEE